MESEMGRFLFSEPSYTPMNSMTQMPETTISSWLNLDDIYIPTFLNELPDYNIPDDQFFDFPASNDQNDPISLHPQLNYTNGSFLFDDLETDTDVFNPVQTETYTSTWSTITTALTPIERSESNQSMDCDAWLAEPAESFESYGEPVLGRYLSVDTPLQEMGVNPAISWTNSAENGSGNEEIGEEEEETDEERKAINSSSKNLVSERNRRKRLSRQLLALRALVPNITKMDKRSVLVDALAYLSSIHEETTELKRELKNPNSYIETQTEPPLPPQRMLSSQIEKSKPKPKSSTQILEIDAEKIEDQRFVVKITCNGGAGAGGEVLRVIESLGFEITYTALDKIKPMLMLLTIFLRVRKQGKMTEEKLKDCITSKALRTGLLLNNP